MRFQSHQDFDHNRPHQISINWQSDIVSEVEEHKDIWLPKNKPESVSRALLSPYTDAILWQPALVNARDFLDDFGAALPFPTALSDEPEAFVKRVRGEARQLYSFWSKGIHCEFFIMSPDILDAVTCVDKLKRTVDLVVELGFVSQFAPSTAGRVPPKTAFELYRQAKELIHV
jgi:hypothetical protein